MATNPAGFAVSRQGFRDRFIEYLRYVRGLEVGEATLPDQLAALELTIRETLIDRSLVTERVQAEHDPKIVYYLSLEYLIGRLVENNLIATGLQEVATGAMADLGLDLQRIMEEEPDPGLGNGGLGRLAACFLESLATLDYPAFGYGLRYDFGIFRQEFVGGWQRERPDRWLKGGYAWEIARPDLAVPVRVGGTVRTQEANGRTHFEWTGARVVYGVPHDVLALAQPAGLPPDNRGRNARTAAHRCGAESGNPTDNEERGEPRGRANSSASPGSPRFGP